MLRVFQEMEFERVGGTRTIKVDVRLIAAANKDPSLGVEEGWFRADLLYRLNVIKIEVPPLRDRKDDIPPLVDHFIAKYARENHKMVEGISNLALDALMDYSYPGNIRELENIIARAVILAGERRIRLCDLPRELSGSSSGEEDSCGNVRSDKLFHVLRKATITSNGGPAKPWHDTLKCTTIEAIHEFLIKTNLQEFSRIELSKFLAKRTNSDRNKYGTAGKYLSVLKKNNICVHNEKKANQSRYRLSEAFMANA